MADASPVSLPVWACGICYSLLRPQAVGVACLNTDCANYKKIFSSKRKDAHVLSLNEIADAAYKNACHKGFWDQHPNGPLHAEAIASKLALIHSEVSEALEDARDGNMETVLDPDGKPTGFGSELADIILRVADLAKRLGIDISNEVTRKMVFNAARPHKHGRRI